MDPTAERRVTLATAVLVAVVAFAPFARGLGSGESFFFRDLSRQFFPLRSYAVDGLLEGELRTWNPYVHEGEAVSLPPLSYPIDLLQLLSPSEWGLSLSLALHGPLAAVAFVGLARGLQLGHLAAACGALVYTLGGFALSSLNLYVHYQALAWAPLVVLGLIKAAEGGGRQIVLAALAVAAGVTTTGVEIIVQAVAIGAVLSLGPRLAARAARLGASLVLGLGLAGHTIAYMGGLIAGTARDAGFPSSIVLAHSVHPMTLVQAVVGGLYGDLAQLADRWWGHNFFPLGFPYLLSLYLGAAAMCVGLVGVVQGRRHRWRLGLLVVVALAVCLGRYAGWEPIVELTPWLRKLRYPVKAYFTVHLAMALLVAGGIEALARSASRRAWLALTTAALAAGGVLAAAPWVTRLAPGLMASFTRGFFPPGFAWPQRAGSLSLLLADARLGGILALAVGGLGLLVVLGRLAPRRAALGIGIVLATDLLRTGAGLNPTVTASFYSLSPEMARQAADLRRQGGRLFSCEPDFSPAYHRARQTRPGDHEVWSFAVNMEVLSPDYNMPARVPSGLTRDLTMLTPTERVLAPAESGCGSFQAIVGRLRRAGVSHVVSLSPIDHPALRTKAVAEPRRVAPLQIHIHTLADALPLRQIARRVEPVSGREAAEALARTEGFLQDGGVAVEGPVAATEGAAGRVVRVSESSGRLELEVEADRPTVLVIRDAFSSGWTAEVDDAPAPIWRADGRHRAVPVPEGQSRVVLRYSAPRLVLGLALAALSAVVAVILWTKSGRG